MAIARSNPGDRKFCFFLLYMLIDSFTHCCFTRCVACTRCRDVLQVSGQTIHAHALLDEGQGVVCVGRHVLELELVLLCLIYS